MPIKMPIVYLVSFAIVLIIWMLLALSTSRKAANETNEIKEIGGKIFYNSSPSTATSMSNVILSEDLKKDD